LLLGASPLGAQNDRKVWEKVTAEAPLNSTILHQRRRRGVLQPGLQDAQERLHSR
jgi:hypothetical protein